MNNYTDTKEFLKDLNVTFPEKVLKLIEIDYTDEELLDYIEERTIEAFQPLDFRSALTIKKVFMESSMSQSITTNINSNPNIGELVLDQTTGKLSVYDGSVWIEVS